MPASCRALATQVHPVATQPISLQLAELECRLRAAPELWQAIEIAREVLPGSYVAGGAITQTIWNQHLGRPAIERLHDIDIVYFEPHGTLESQRAMERVLRQGVTSGIPIDLTNEALTHTWYESKFAATIEPYQSAEAAINTWLPAFGLDEEADADAETLWEQEIRKRVEQIDSGTVRAVPWSEARKQILIAAGRDPSS